MGQIVMRVARKNERSYVDKVREVLTHAEAYHLAYYKADTFRGPSLYFHRRALETNQSPGDVAHLEYVYATLTSWGMHRMGKRGSKMRPFDVFKRSIGPLTAKISEAQRFDLTSMTDAQWAVVRDVFLGIDVMASATKLVGHSKVLHHMMPNVVPPIDREYTLRYLHANTTIKNDPQQEWLTLKAIVSGFFLPVASDAGFQRKASEWIANQDKYPWDTSVLKVVDNLLIGAKK
jgi:hypothetical protein